MQTVAEEIVGKIINKDIRSRHNRLYHYQYRSSSRYPKPKEDTPKKSNRKPAKKSGGVVPYTGDSNATGIAIALASAAVVLIGGGIYLRHRSHRE